MHTQLCKPVMHIDTCAPVVCIGIRCIYVAEQSRRNNRSKGLPTGGQKLLLSLFIHSYHLM